MVNIKIREAIHVDGLAFAIGRKEYGFHRGRERKKVLVHRGRYLRMCRE